MDQLAHDILLGDDGLWLLGVVIDYQTSQVFIKNKCELPYRPARQNYLKIATTTLEDWARDRPNVFAMTQFPKWSNTDSEIVNRYRRSPSHMSEVVSDSTE